MRNSSRRGRNWRGTGSFSVELHITTLSTPPGGPRGPPEHVPRPGQGRVHIVVSIPTRVKALDDGREWRSPEQDTPGSGDTPPGDVRLFTPVCALHRARGRGPRVTCGKLAQGGVVEGGRGEARPRARGSLHSCVDSWALSTALEGMWVPTRRTASSCSRGDVDLVMCSSFASARARARGLARSRDPCRAVVPAPLSLHS